MADSTVRVRGVKEAVRAFNKMDKKLGQEFKNEMKKAAEPVAETARQKITRYRGASTNIVPIAKGASVFVRQRARKVTGKRSDFGLTQMRTVFEPAAEERQSDVIKGVEDALDRFSRESDLT